MAVAVGILPLSVAAQVTTPHPGMRVLDQGAAGRMVVQDLCAAGAGVRVTKYGERGKTAPVWAGERGAEAAINGDFFVSGFGVIGRARGAGETWPAAAQQREGRAYFQFGPELAQLVTDPGAEPREDATEVVGAHDVVVQGGQVANVPSDSFTEAARPRSGLGVSEDGRYVYLFASTRSIKVRDVGTRMLEMANAAGGPPVFMAGNLDGGGSTQLFVRGAGALVSSTRQVANHVGLHADGEGEASFCHPPYRAEVVGAPLAAPIAVKPGARKTIALEMKNTGSAVWDDRVRLAPIPRDQPSPLASPAWMSEGRIGAVVGSVPPAQSTVFTFEVTAPDAIGDYTQALELVAEGVTWFADAPVGGGPAKGALTLRLHVAVDADGADGGAPSAAADDPDAGCAVHGSGEAPWSSWVLGASAVATIVGIARRRRALRGR